MTTYRFGRKLKLPSTIAIKRQLLMMMLEDEIKTSLSGVPFNGAKSPALAQIRQLAAEPRSRFNGPDKEETWCSKSTTFGDQRDEETPYDDITGYIFSTIHKLNIDADGPETLEMIWRDAPQFEDEWQIVRAVLKTLTLAQIRELTAIKQREQTLVRRL